MHTNLCRYNNYLMCCRASVCLLNGGRSMHLSDTSHKPRTASSTFGCLAIYLASSQANCHCDFFAATEKGRFALCAGNVASMVGNVYVCPKRVCLLNRVHSSVDQRQPRKIREWTAAVFSLRTKSRPQTNANKAHCRAVRFCCLCLTSVRFRSLIMCSLEMMKT